MNTRKTVVQPSDGADYCFCTWLESAVFFFMKSKFIDEKVFSQAKNEANSESKMNIHAFCINISMLNGRK